MTNFNSEIASEDDSYQLKLSVSLHLTTSQALNIECPGMSPLVEFYYLAGVCSRELLLSAETFGVPEHRQLLINQELMHARSPQMLPPVALRNCTCQNAQ